MSKKKKLGASLAAITVAAGLGSAYAFTQFRHGPDPSTTLPSTVSTIAPPSPANGIPVLNYHGIGPWNPDPATDAWYNVTLTQFSQQMAWLHSQGYHTVTPAQYSAWQHGSNAPLPSKPILLTFDDAWAGTLNGTAVLRRYGYQGVLYVITGFSDHPTGPEADNGPVASWAQLRTAQASGAWITQLHAGPCGHDYMLYPSNGCGQGLNLSTAASDPYYYVNMFGQSPAAYQTRVENDLATGTAEIKKKLGLPANWKSVTFAVPFSKFGTPGNWFSRYLASQFSTVFVQDTYPGAKAATPLNMRYRAQISDTTTMAQFTSAVQGDYSRPVVKQPPALAPSVPIKVTIPAIGVNAPVMTVGTVNGSVGVPPLSASNLAAWWNGSSTPGQAGRPALIDGHVNNPNPAVFSNLKNLVKGDQVEVFRKDGKEVTFTVTWIQAVSKSAFPWKQVLAPSGVPGLRLVTCGGPFDYSTGHYTENIVIWATEKSQ